MKLSVIIPVFNEASTIAEIIKMVQSVPIEKQIIVVDDGSEDKTAEILRQTKNIELVVHKQNTGKGMAIRSGLERAQGEFVIIQDADLEYNPEDYIKLLQPLETGEADVVFGSRNLGRNQTGPKLYLWGGKFLSWLANFLYGLSITDEATCYKVMPTKTIKKLDLHCRRFEFCPEVTAKLARRGYKIKEVPISYRPRFHNQGKKIKLRDGLAAIWTLIKYRFIG